MIEKDRSYPLRLIMYEALLERISSMDLPYTGSKNSRIYHMPADIEAFFDITKNL